MINVVYAEYRQNYRTVLRSSSSQVIADAHSGLISREKSLITFRGVL